MGDSPAVKPKSRDVYVNVPRSSIDGGKRVYCPLCYYDLRDVPMVFDVINKIWKCNYCKYTMLHEHNPVENPTITAGNDVETAAPYMKAVSFHRNSPKLNKNEVFTNAAQAYAAD